MTSGTGERQLVMPSGAANTQTTMIVPVTPRSSSSWQVWPSEPPVASIGSSTMHCRPASDSGSLLTYGLGWNVSSSRDTPMKPTSALGSNSCAA